MKKDCTNTAAKRAKLEKRISLAREEIEKCTAALAALDGNMEVEGREGEGEDEARVNAAAEFLRQL